MQNDKPKLFLFSIFANLPFGEKTVKISFMSVIVILLSLWTYPLFDSIQ